MFLQESKTTMSGNSVVLKLEGGVMLRVDVLSERVFRLRYQMSEPWCESGLNRYGVLKEDFADVEFTSGDGVFSTKSCRVSVAKDGSLSFMLGDRQVTSVPTPPVIGKGYSLSFRLADDERIYGLGDCSRENIMRRGEAYQLWVIDVSGYIPVPMALSSAGWGILVNTTWRNAVDVGKGQHDLMTFTANESNLDFYLFAGGSLPELLDIYTELTGRPKLLPIWGYAFTYVCHEKATAFDVMNEAVTFRKEGIPCDLIGLEPGWMETNYDQTIDKKWHPERFPMPYWAMTSPYTFPNALKRKGFKLSLWLCCDYDLTEYEEALLKGEGLSETASALDEGDGDAFEKDAHIHAEYSTDDAKGSKNQAPEPWFEHLKKFVDQGAAAFKLDGAWQVCEHPDRIYANGMNDEQAHNLYPLIYDKQMATCFETHANRRAMIYTASGYAGLQQYVASWAGDTGGGPKPLASMLNLAFSGHSNHSCDMEVMSLQGIHFGFLQTWAQLNNWAYWRQPWYLEDKDCDVFREYTQLRYRILPYLYSSAWQASQTGMPVMRPMPLIYNDARWDGVKDEYMLGDAFLVTAFATELKLPEGEWLDFWTGRRIVGPAVIPAEYPADRGGCLLLKAGAIVPTWPVRPFTPDGFSDTIGIIANPSGTESSFVLYEDDGNTLEYQKGKCCTTRITCKSGSLQISPAVGDFPQLPAKRSITLEIHLAERPNAFTVDGVTTKFSWRDGVATIALIHDTTSSVSVTWE